ncbi:zinc finger BED domain-containing protein RICESLEEPER 2-like [Chenopodium quinoa]|uniref:zinc finger BED domain-containing protein RICESLEEPER 2-like n=1 Tax=Chenopodium quinoa TaxID=63459 RepID=UPI000B773133|nr:zinc finger BED domain-containing protein RICESLEEPER 2-like [Chenopodium quinoa]
MAEDGFDYAAERGKRSPIWQNFEINGEHAACKFCKRLVQKHSGSTGTSNLKRHLDKCPLYKDSGKSDESNASEFDQKEYCKLFARAILKHGYSLSIVEHEGFRELHTYLNSKVRTISRNTILKWCMTEHDVLKQYVRNTFKALTSKVSLTCDVWTACTTRGYLSLTAHFVDNDWKLRSKVLNFRHFPPPHNGHEIYNLVFSLIKDWGIERKIYSMTIDNASNMDSMVGKLQIELDAMAKLPLDGKYFHVRCSAHILNLIVKEGLKVIDESVAKVRENVKYVDSSEARLIRFERCVSSCNLATGVKLWMDVPTRWNSTFLMLRRALDLLPALKMFGRIESNYHLALTAHEWDIVEKMCDFLEPFYDITNLFSGSEYPTSNLYVSNICRIESLLVAASKGDDPKTQRNGRSYALQDLYEAHMVETKVQEVYHEFVQLFNHYKDPLPTYSSQGSSNSDAYRPRKTSRVYANFVADVASGDMGKYELELYLELPLKPCNVDEEFDILGYWKEQSTTFPSLGRIAKYILVIPITTVASESSFSMGGRVLNRWRSSLLHKHVEALITTRNWLYGYAELEKDGVEVEKEKDVDDTSVDVTHPRLLTAVKFCGRTASAEFLLMFLASALLKSDPCWVGSCWFCLCCGCHAGSAVAACLLPGLSMAAGVFCVVCFLLVWCMPVFTAACSVLQGVLVDVFVFCLVVDAVYLLLTALAVPSFLGFLLANLSSAACVCVSAAAGFWFELVWCLFAAGGLLEVGIGLVVCWFTQYSTFLV